MPAARLIPAGARFGEMTVTADRAAGERVQLRCDCGTELTVAITNIDRQQNCYGTAHRTGAGNSNYRHGHSPTGAPSSTYTIWAQMVQRTTNPQHPRWADYGGRGIDLDPRWRDFPTFLADMGERPDGLTIERVDNNRGYWPDNCCWATYTEQRHNRRDTTP
jgi:hypothetical protein